MIETWSQGRADEGMPQSMLTETLEKVQRHPWWLARAQLALAVLRRYGVTPPASIIEIGCGWGINLTALESVGFSVTGLDISRDILERIECPGRHLIEADLSQELPARAGGFDGLLALDVIEHLDDDQGAIRKIAPLLRIGGVALISVPARPDLFSEFDRIQGHRRRYSPETLRGVFAGSGLEVCEIFWWGAWMVPLLRRMRIGNGDKKNNDNDAKTYSDYLRLPPWPIPLLMKWIYRWEQPRALKGCLQTGTSLFAIAKRANK